MSDPPLRAPKILSIHLQISQYPILAKQIRRRMRDELYRRGVISRERLEAEVKEKAELSQKREGLVNPLAEEGDDVWEQRLQQIRDQQTDFYFAYNLPIKLFESLIEELLAERSVHREESGLALFNPELTPVELLLHQLEQLEALPEERRERARTEIEAVTAVLVKTMVSDQPGFGRMARRWLAREDFQFIQSRRIGEGKIGGKAGGLLLAWKILRTVLPQEIHRMAIPNSYFIGADVFYHFLADNHLELPNQKHKSLDQVRSEYPTIQEEFLRHRLPEDVADRLREILITAGNTPLIARSSSLLEDGVGTAFAGKYVSVFCPNQGTVQERLRDLTAAVQRVYASVFNPDALFYRGRMGLLDYDERMSVLIQEVQGSTYRDGFFPTLAGVAFSYSPIVWDSRLRKEEGFCRLVMGLGTRAVVRVAEDYPRLVMLSHPALRPENTPADIRRYSQKIVDVIDLRCAELSSWPVSRLLRADYPVLRWLASVDRGDTVMPVFSIGPDFQPERMVLTMDNFLQQSDFVGLLKGVLSTLAREYGVPVNVEFAVTLDPESATPEMTFHLLQCRAQTGVSGGVPFKIPKGIPAEDKFFIATRVVPQGAVRQVDAVCFVDPEAYGALADAGERKTVAGIIGRLNKLLEGRSFILIGPGRWGSINPLLGVPVTYADIFNTRALVELAVTQQGAQPEPSYGTHFFQDLVEASIFPIAVYPDQPGDLFRPEWMANAKNSLAEMLPDVHNPNDCVKLVNIPREFDGKKMDLLMDGETAVAFLVEPDRDGYPERAG
jgi:hypothetical protein